jgi:hypothetical protein
VPTTLTIDWDGEAPAEGTTKFNDQKALEYLRTNSVRIDRISVELWKVVPADVYLVGVFNMAKGIHVLRPLNPRTVHDAKVGGDVTQKAMDGVSLDTLLTSFPGWLREHVRDEVGGGDFRITHKPTGGKSPTSHSQVVGRLTRNAGAEALNREKDESFGYAIRKMAAAPHVLFFQSQTLNNAKFHRSLRNDPQTANLSRAWARVIRLSLELLLPGG